MNRERLRQIEENFDNWVASLLNEDDPEDYRMMWEFKKFVHTKKLKILTAEEESLKKLKALLVSR